jgi:hypothetical protein
MQENKLIWPGEPKTTGGNALGKTFTLTIDLESDYCTGYFQCLEKSGPLLDYLKNNVSEFTVFCEGNVLRAAHPIIESLLNTGGDMQLHCNDHRDGPDDIDGFEKGLGAYIKYFGYMPAGYRAGKYRMDAQLITHIINRGLKWDSSLIPVFLEKKYCNPYLLNNNFIEFPASVCLADKFIMSMTYNSFFGPAVFELLKGHVLKHSYINFTVHLQDLFPSKSLSRASLKRKMIYHWHDRFGFRNPFNFFTGILDFLIKNNYRPVSLSNLYSDILEI